jgi:ribosomal protein S18 acetylase RimI-like enzyme
MLFNKITMENIHLLKTFINLNTSNFFRYYNKRNINIIKNHLITLVLTNNNEIIGYGHLDFENKIWLGICILEKHTGNCYGKNIMNYLIDYACKNKIKQIHLSVDKDNIIARNIYEKYYFKTIKTTKNIYIMKKNIDIK